MFKNSFYTLLSHSNNDVADIAPILQGNPPVSIIILFFSGNPISTESYVERMSKDYLTLHCQSLPRDVELRSSYLFLYAMRMLKLIQQYIKY